MHKPLPSIEILMCQRGVGNFLGIFKSRVKGSDGGYKLSELSSRGGGADAVVNVRCQKVAANVQPNKSCLF